MVKKNRKNPEYEWILYSDFFIFYLLDHSYMYLTDSDLIFFRKLNIRLQTYKRI